MSIDIVKSVAKYAEPKDSMLQGMNQVHFRKGQVFAVSLRGSAAAPTNYDFACGVDAQKLLKAFAAVGPDPDIQMRERKLEIRSGTAVVRLDITSAGRTAPKLHLPQRPHWVEVKGMDATRRISWAASTDNSRPAMMGVALTQGGIVASNGHVAVLYGDVDYLRLLGLKEPVIIVPEMVGCFPDPAYLAFEDQRLHVSSGGEQPQLWSIQPLAAHYPDVLSIFRNHSEQPAIEISRVELVDLLKRAKNASMEVTLSFANERLSVITEQLGEADERTLFDFLDTCPFKSRGRKKLPPGTIRLRLQYLLPLLEKTATSDTVELRVSPDPKGSLDPLVVVDGPLRAIQMPMRL
jgi:hypothetical protein